MTVLTLEIQRFPKRKEDPPLQIVTTRIITHTHGQITTKRYIVFLFWGIEVPHSIFTKGAERIFLNNARRMSAKQFRVSRGS